MMKDIRLLSAPSFKLNSYQVLQTISLLYIAIPALLFIAGWLQVFIAVPLILLTLWGIYRSLLGAWDYNSLEKIESTFRFKLAQYLPIVLLVIFFVICSGLGGFSAQDGDYYKHNAFFRDLTEYSWPIGYHHTGPDGEPRVLNTYFGYYLPAALVGKMFGWSAGYFFSFLWACSGLLLSILWILRFVRGWPILFALMFLIFGGLDVFGWHFVVGADRFGMFGYTYARWMVNYTTHAGSDILNGIFWLLGSNHNFITNGPHHIFPSWVCILMLFHDAVRRESNDRTLFIASFLPFVSAFASIGLFPFVLLGLFHNRLKKSFTWQNLLVGPLLVVVAGLFLISNNGQFTKGWVWTFVDMGETFPILILFYLLGFGSYFLVMPKSKRYFKRNEMFWLYGAVICILVFPVYRMGLWMDFPIKAFIPSWIIFQVCLAMALSRIFTYSSATITDKIRGGVLIVLVFIGSLSAFNNLYVALKKGLFKNRVRLERIQHINARKRPHSLQLYSDGQTFFWKYLAKTVIYEPRNQISDEFGNSFSLTAHRCGEQDFRILVNGRPKGCGVNLSKTEEGYVQLFSSFGDIATYIEKGWNYDLYMDKFGNIFTVDSKECDQNQGFIVLVNGEEDGCCVKLSKTANGFTEKLTASGHTWTYTPQGWFRNHSTANINEIDSLHETNNIKSFIRLQQNQQSFYIDNGWALVEGTGSRHSDTWIVLQSQSERYIFHTNKLRRYEIVRLYGSFDYLESGIHVKIPKKEINPGLYQVGLLITNRHKILGFKFTDKKLVRNFDGVELDHLDLKETYNVIHNLKIKKSNKLTYILDGWAYVKGQSAQSKIYMVLKSKVQKFIYPVTSKKRPELVVKYGEKARNAGFRKKIPVDTIPEGNYQVGILVTQGPEILGFQYTNRQIKVGHDWLSVQLPEQTANVQNYLFLKEDSNTFQVKNGWAFVEGVSSDRAKTFVVLKSDTEQNIFPTKTVNRMELGSKFGPEHVNAGFTFKIKKNELKEGKYKIGLMIVNIKKQKIEGFQYTDKEIIIGDKYVGDIAINKELPAVVDLPDDNPNLQFTLEVIEDKESIIINDGWAFIKTMPSKDHQIYVTLSSDQTFYAFSTVGNKRYELAELYAPQYVDSGFTLKVSKDIIKAGTYHIGLIIAQGEKIIGVKTTKKSVSIIQ